MNLSDDIRSVTDLKRQTHQLLKQTHETGRPIILTVNGRADAVLLDAKTYEKFLAASNLSRLLAPAEEEVAAGEARPMEAFFKEFKRARKTKG